MSKYEIKVDGIVETEDLYLIGFERYSNMEKLPELMKADFMKLCEYADKVELTGPAIAVYKGFDLETLNTCTLHALQVEPTEESAATCMQVLDDKGMWAVLPPFPAVLKVTLTGSYDNLKEAWQTAYKFIEENELIPDTYASPWEAYKVNPADTNGDDSKLVTEIFAPLIPLEDEEEVIE